MAEAVAAVALASSVVQLIDFGTKLLGRLNEFGSDFKDVPKSFAGIKSRLPLLVDSLSRTKAQSQSQAVSDTTAEALSTVIQDCLTQIERLDILLSKVLPAPGSSDWSRRWKALKSLAHDRTVQEAESALSRCIESLLFYQSSQNLGLTHAISLRQLAEAAVPVQQPSRPVFALPFDRNIDFIGREAILGEIDAGIGGGRRCVALTGIGGIGKSQLAIEFAYKHVAKNPTTNLFWVHASTRARFEEAYKDIARQIHVPDLEDPDLLRLVRERLESNDVQPWLLILDNADDMPLFFGSPEIPGSSDQPRPERPLWEYLPRTTKGALLITSRDARVCTRLVNGRGVIFVGALDAEEGRGLVCKRLQDDDLDGEDLEQLLETLDYVPLAISQATAFIQENGLGVKEYLEILLKGDAEMNDLLDEEYHDPARDPEIQNSIFRTWRISEQILKQSPRAAEILFLIAVLDRQSVPKSLLEKEGENAVDFSKAIGTIQAFSLISTERGGGVYEMHRLVHLFVRNRLDAEDARLPWDLDLLKTTWESLRPHAEAILYKAVTRQPSDLRRAHLLQRLARYEDSFGQSEAANRKLTKALEIYTLKYGPLHIETLFILDDYAWNLRTCGRYGQAEMVYRRIVEVAERERGCEAGVTLRYLSNLAAVLQLRRKYEEAHSIYVRILELTMQTLGPRHLDTLSTENNIAILSGLTGQYEEAERQHRKVLAAMEELVGSSHEEAIGCRNDLVHALLLQHKLEEAEKLGRSVIELATQTLGVDHPMVASALGALGRVLGRARKDEEAEKVWRTALLLRQKLLGRGHPLTLEFMKKLASVLYRQSKGAEADNLQRQRKILAKGNRQKSWDMLRFLGEPQA